MRSILDMVISGLRLSRVAAGYAAAINISFVILWSRAETAEAGERISGPLLDAPLVLLLLGGGVTALGLYAFAVTLNNLVDANRDRALRHDRVILPSDARSETAVVWIAVALIVAILGATVFGTPAVLATLLVASAILVFLVFGRYIPAAGMPLIALIYAGHMMIPNLGLAFLVPVWLAMTQHLVVAWASYVVSRRTPRLSRRAIAFAVLSWLFWTGVLAWFQHDRLGTVLPFSITPMGVLLPAGSVALMAIVIIRRARATGWGGRSAEKIERYASVWLGAHHAAWLAAAGHSREAIAVLALTLLAAVSIGILRELHGLIEQPVGFRR